MQHLKNWFQYIKQIENNFLFIVVFFNYFYGMPELKVVGILVFDLMMLFLLFTINVYETYIKQIYAIVFHSM